jgi:hypothetical protein
MKGLLMVFLMSPLSSWGLYLRHDAKGPRGTRTEWDLDPPGRRRRALDLEALNFELGVVAGLQIDPHDASVG